MKYILQFIICLGIIISTNSYSQLPDFIQRLDGGSSQSGNYSEKVKVRLSDNRVYLNASVSGRDCILLIDTYSPCLFYRNILDDSNPDTLDRTNLLGKIFEKTFLLPIYPKFDTIKIRSISFFDIGAMLMKSDKSNPLLEYNIDGILGANLMNKSIWQFNFTDTFLTITNNKDNLQNIKDANNLKFTQKPIQGSPNTFIIINKDTVNAEFDTGNSGFINAISPSIKEKIKNGDAVPWSINLKIPVNREDLDSIETHYYVLLDSVRIGTEIYYHIPIIAYNPEIVTESKGSIGMGFIKKYITTIDWRENIIYLKEQDNFKLYGNKKTFGFTCEMKNDKLVINSIFNNSLAAKQGLHINNVIISINDIPIESFTKEAINYFISNISEPETNGENIKLSVSQKGVVKQFEIESYNIFK